MYKERLKNLVNSLTESCADPEFILDGQEFIRSCTKYIETVCTSKVYILLRNSINPKEFRTQFAQLDKARSASHNYLISKVKMMNRYCEMAGSDPLFSGDIKNRIEIAEFAQIITEELFSERKK